MWSNYISKAAGSVSGVQCSSTGRHFYHICRKITLPNTLTDVPNYRGGSLTEAF